MDEMNWTLPPELNDALTGFYAAPEPSTAFASRLDRELVRRQTELLQAQSVSRFPLWKDKRKSIMQTLRARPLLVIVLALFVILLLTSVAYAIGNMLGYIPGIGFVQTNSLRVLAEPVSQTRDGITLTVEEAVLSSDETVIVYTLEGVQWDDMLSHDENVPGCLELAKLRLPNGLSLQMSGGSSTLGSNRFWYSPISANVSEATFILPCISGTLPGKAPENWELQLHFIPAPSGMATPVIEMPTSQSDATAGPAPVSIEKAMQIGDQYILIGKPDGQSSEACWNELTDANGRKVSSSPPTIEGLPPYQWGVQFKGDAVAFPVTITFSCTIFTTLPNATAEFEFDAGENPQPGQEWILNRDVQIGGRTVHVASVTVDNRDGYTFNFDVDSDVSSLNVEIPGYEALGGGGGRWEGHFERSIIFAKLPAGKLRVHLFELILFGGTQTWQIQWSPENPLAAETPAPTTEPEACLTLDKWNQLTVQYGPPPHKLGVGGKIVTIVNEGGPLPAIYVSGPDGADLQKIAIAAWPSLSNDGTHLAYSAADGLHVLDLAGEQNTALGMDGYRIIWSPDNTRMMFTTTFNLYVVNADGSGLQTVNTGPAQVISPVGWLSDNQTVVYSILNGAGFDLKTYNLQSGEAEDLFTIHNKAGFGSISPDGQWIVFADRLSSDATNWSIFISRLDGSERKLVAEPEVPTDFTSVWSPDGQWLILNTQTTEREQIPVLVNPFTCQAVRLQNINGIVEGWSP
ncbi:MAG: hypothetical protein ABIL11_16020 [Chloroflexota bacterium]